MQIVQSGIGVTNKSEKIGLLNDKDWKIFYIKKKNKKTKAAFFILNNSYK